MDETKELLEALFNCVLLGQIQRASEIAKQAARKGLSATAALEKMREAMRVVDEKYERKEYFIVDVASAASAMREAIRVLKPAHAFTGKVLIGSLKGNTQGLGKDIVAATLSAAGFQVIDLGVDVLPKRFVDTAIKENAQVIAISVSVKETVPFLEDLMNHLRQRALVGKVKTVIGGPAVSEEKREEYGIDAYAKDAWDCAKKIEQLLDR